MAVRVRSDLDPESARGESPQRAPKNSSLVGIFRLTPHFKCRKLKLKAINNQAQGGK